MGRKTIKQKTIENVLVELSKKHPGLAMGLKIEELTNVAYGDERLLMNELRTYLDFSYTIHSNYVKDDKLVEYLTICGHAFLSTQSSVDYLNKLLSVTTPKGTDEETEEEIDVENNGENNEESVVE